MSDKQIERIERELRNPGPREAADGGRGLPGDVRHARLLLSEIDGRRNSGRLVVRATAVGLVAAAAVAVAIVIGASPRSGIEPGASETPQPTAAATPTGSQAASVCAVSNLQAVAERWGAAAGSRGTTVHITLVSGPDCVLQGHPGARIVAGDGSLLVASLDPANRPTGQPWKNPGERAVTITRGGGTTVVVLWSNWCGANPSAPELELRLAPDGPQLAVAMSAGESIPAPPCNGPGQPSSLGTNAFGE